MLCKKPLPKIRKEDCMDIKTPTDADWSLYSRTYNKRVPVEPKLVLLPATVRHIAKGVQLAAELKLPIQVRSGGHSYASHSNGGADGAVVMDMRLFQDISFEPHNIVRVGSGVRLGKLAKTLYEKRGRALAHGTCPSVGIGGHFTHGGFGFTSRAWGLAMDQIVALDVVTASGQLLRASPTRNKELFTAMRGAADSFGIVVNFYLRTQPAPNSVIKFTLDVPAAMESVPAAVQAFQHVQSVAQNESVTDRRLGLVLYISHNRFTIEGTYIGGHIAFESTVLPALLSGFTVDEDDLPKGAKLSINDFSWLETLKLFAHGEDLESNGTGGQTFFSKCAVVSRPGLSTEAMENYFRYILREGAKAPVEYFIGVQLYGGADSQITAGNGVDDAFAHRDAMWVFQHYAAGKDPQATEFPKEGVRFVEELHRSLGHGHGAYNNYADPSLAPDEARKMYYGDKLDGLRRLKGKLDPENLFSHPQSIKAE